MSVYNPKRGYLEAQIDSLLKQDYPIDLYIRDDGSPCKEHYEYLKELSSQDNIFVKYGDNVGVFHSFMDGLRAAFNKKEYDLFGFSDQDDIALPSKVSSAVKFIDSKSVHSPILYFSQMAYTDSNLKITGYPSIDETYLGIENALFEVSTNGNLIFLNSEACELVLRHNPRTFSMHDHWCYLCVAAFGEVFYDKTLSLLYRQHESNVVGGSTNSWDIMKSRLKRLLSRGTKAYNCWNNVHEFYGLYKDELKEGTRRTVIEDFLKSKANVFSRIHYAAVLPKHARRKFWDRPLLKMMIVFDMY